MLIRTIILLTIVLTFIFNACSPEQSEVIVAKFGGREIKLSEFEQAYAKNAGSYEKAKNDSISRLKNFLDLYLNFKMKLRDAEVRDYDSHPELVAELEDYKDKVGVTYLLEKRVVEPGIKQLYDRRKMEYRVSHLMIRPEPGKGDEALEIAQAILDSIKEGFSGFEQMVKKHSHDEFSKNDGGDIFYITAGLLPVEFEDAVYLTGEGEIYPEVVMTRYGYHLIKVTEIRDRIPAIRASHILINYTNDDGVADTASAKAVADSVYKKLLDGEDFIKLAEEYSDDTGTKERGGDLGFFERRQMVKEFDETAFNLGVGEISGIVQTNFGFHIIKLTEKRPYPSFDEDRENIKKMFQNTRYQQDLETFNDMLKGKYNFTINNETFDFILSISDTIRLTKEHPRFDEFKNMHLFSYAGKQISAGEFFEAVFDKKEYYNKPMTEEIFDKAINVVAADYLYKEEASHLEQTDSEFAALMDDYRNGIFIFRLQEDEVWNKIHVDSTKLYEFYLDTKENYRFPDRVSFAEIFTKSDSLADYYYNLLENGADFDTLVANYTERPGFKEKGGEHTMQSVVTSVLYEEAFKLEKPGDYSKPVKVVGGYSIVKLIEKDPSRVKTFEEARAEVAGAFQEAESKRLEQAYLDNLKNRYKPVVYYSELEKAFKSEE